MIYASRIVMIVKSRRVPWFGDLVMWETRECYRILVGKFLLDNSHSKDRGGYGRITLR
jgi:hypothetical protein